MAVTGDQYGGKGPMVVAMSWVLFVTACFFAVARVYTRAFILHSLGSDDYLTLVTVVLTLVYTIFITISARYGLGKTVAEINNLEDYAEAMKFEIVAQAIGIFIIITAKCAVAAFLLRIVVVRSQRILIWASIFVTTVLTGFSTVAVIIQCLPVQATWDSRLRATSNCWLNFTPVGIATALTRKDEVVVASGLSLGVMAGASGIVRTVAFQGLNANEHLDTTGLLIWSSPEITVTILCASIPVLRALYVQIWHNGKDSVTDPANSYGGTGAFSGSISRTLGMNSNAYALNDFSQTGGSKSHDSKYAFESSAYSCNSDAKKGSAAHGPHLTPSEESILRDVGEPGTSPPVATGSGGSGRHGR